MKTFLQYLKELSLYHSGSSEGGYRGAEDVPKTKKQRKETPIWLSHQKKAGKQYHHDITSDDYEGKRRGVHLSRVRYKGQVAHHKNPHVKKLLKTYGHSDKHQDEYHKTLSHDPDHKTVHNHPITKALKKHNYIGYTHPDTQLQSVRKVRKRIKGKKVTQDKKDFHTNTVVFHRKDTEFTKTLKGKREED